MKNKISITFNVFAQEQRMRSLSICLFIHEQEMMFNVIGFQASKELHFIYQWRLNCFYEVNF